MNKRLIESGKPGGEIQELKQIKVTTRNYHIKGVPTPTKTREKGWIESRGGSKGKGDPKIPP